MIIISIYNFETEKLKEYRFESLVEAEDFASNYDCSEDEEITIGNEDFGMEWTDYLCFVN